MPNDFSQGNMFVRTHILCASCRRRRRRRLRDKRNNAAAFHAAVPSWSTLWLSYFGPQLHDRVNSFFMRLRALFSLKAQPRIDKAKMLRHFPPCNCPAGCAVSKFIA